jgi:hypothetical protein
MSTETLDGRIRKRMAEIDQHISFLMKERDELVFAQRVLERLLDGGQSAVAAVTAPLKIEAEAPVEADDVVGTTPEPAAEQDGIEAALSKLESWALATQRR